jgi:hypothetical protein
MLFPAREDHSGVGDKNDGGCVSLRRAEDFENFRVESIGSRDHGSVDQEELALQPVRQRAGC